MTQQVTFISFQEAATLTVLLLCLALLFASGYWIWRRVPRKRLLARLSASFIAVLALFALAVRPQWLSQTRSEATAVLYTAGADKYDSQIDAAGETTALRFALPEVQRGGRADFIAIPDLGYLQRHHPEIRRLHVFGHGLFAYDWLEWPDVAITPHFAPLSPGFEYVHWQRSLQLGQRLTIQGRLVGADSVEHFVVLTDPGGLADSTAIQPHETTAFELHTKPRDAGLYLYTLCLRTGQGRVLATERLAVHVQPSRPLHILILESAPSFETKYLKRWAAKQQHRLALRTTISRARYRYEFLNHAEIDLKRVRAELLRRFDLVITDARTLQSLRPQERAQIRAAVAQEGLGILLRADDTSCPQTEQDFSEADFFLPFQRESFPDLKERLVKPLWPETEAQRLTTLPAEPCEILPDWRSMPLIRDEQDRMLAAAQQRGQGRVGFTLVHETYRWILEGHPQWHASYWAHLFSELACRAEPFAEWTMANDAPIYIDRPVALATTTGSQQPYGVIKTANVPPDSIFLRQDEIEPTRWHGTFWPRTTGWHEISAGTGETTWFYAYAKDAWQTWQQSEKIAATSRQAMRSNERVHELNTRMISRGKTIPPIWFFALFLLGCLYLWIERKL